MRTPTPIFLALAALAAPALADTFADDFSKGLRPELWLVTQTTAGQYSLDDSHDDLRLARLSPTNPGGLQHLAVNLDLDRFGGPVEGDFSAQVSFRDAVVVLPGLNQVELHSAFADGRYLFVVYDNEGGLNVHVWDGAFRHRINLATDHGLLRITRTGSTVTGFFDDQTIFSITDSTPLTLLRFVLQNNFGGASMISVTYDDFLMTAANACPADFNADGFVDFFDYDDYVRCFETGECPPGKTADFNDDAFADFFDYLDFVDAFEHGC